MVGALTCKDHDMHRAIIAAIFLQSLSAQAGDLPVLTDYLSGIRADVSATGWIGLGIGWGAPDSVSFMPNDGSKQLYPSQLAVDRDTLRALREGCSVNSPMYSSRDMCAVKISAEVQITAGKVELTIFEIDGLTLPSSASAGSGVPEALESALGSALGQGN